MFARTESDDHNSPYIVLQSAPLPFPRTCHHHHIHTFFLLLFMSQLQTIITKLGTKSTELLRTFVCRDSFESTGFCGNQHVSALVLSHLASSWPSHLAGGGGCEVQ